MVREFTFFSFDVIESELQSLQDRDRAKLISVMEHYEQAGFGTPYPADIADYGNEIKRIKHSKNAYQGRALFFVSESREGYQKLVVLTVFKKEANKVPNHVIERARQRMQQHKENNP